MFLKGFQCVLLRFLRTAGVFRCFWALLNIKHHLGNEALFLKCFWLRQIELDGRRVQAEVKGCHPNKLFGLFLRPSVGNRTNHFLWNRFPYQKRRRTQKLEPFFGKEIEGLRPKMGFEGTTKPPPVGCLVPFAGDLQAAKHFPVGCFSLVKSVGFDT